MVIKLLAFSGANTKLFDYAIKIRFKVFCDEQKVDKDIEYDGLDFDAVHFLLTIDDKPAATARYRETNEGIKVERMAVLKEYRGNGYAMLLLRFILNEVKNAKQKIYLHAQSQVVGFYELNHFKTVGNEFLEADIKHFKMEYTK